MTTIRLSKAELKWIERTADIESALAMNKFLELVKIDIKNLKEEDVKMIKSISNELIDCYTFLRGLRTKLELWDCRYDIDKEIEFREEKK